MKTPSIKAIGYIRVSTEAQASEGVSLEAQAAKIRAYADLNGLELVAIEADEGISGKRADNRPGLQRALQRIQSGEAAHLIAYSLSRITRSVADFANLVGEFEERCSGLHSVSERLDTSSASGRLVANVLASFAAFEREVIGERTRCALAYKTSRGEKTGGELPYGFALAADGKSLEALPAEVAILEAIKAEKAAGRSLAAIARNLNAQAIPAKRGSRWYPETVKRALANADRLAARVA